MKKEQSEILTDNSQSKIIGKPLLKWTGGKYKEYACFKHLIPEYDRYFEPFFGGGGVFFAIGQYQCPAYINDRSNDLIDFYKNIGNAKLKKDLCNLDALWQNMKELSKQLYKPLLLLHNNYKIEAITKTELKEDIKIIVTSLFKKKKFTTSYNDHNLINVNNFIFELKKNIFSKLSRLVAIENKHAKIFSDNEMAVHFETAICSAFYMHLRHLINFPQKYEKTLSKTFKIASWFMVRELCYASMFRYNKNGKFNIPYGGIAYNAKNIKKKIENIFSQNIKKLFSNTTIYNEDFERFMNRHEFTDRDFIFLDPPYDSEFSEYDQNAFTQNDQKRLAELLYTCKAKWMVVIKNTNFIYALYNKENIRINTFDKTYRYNVRSRNARDTEHLIITNY